MITKTVSILNVEVAAVSSIFLTRLPQSETGATGTWRYDYRLPDGKILRKDELANELDDKSIDYVAGDVIRAITAKNLEEGKMDPPIYEFDREVKTKIDGMDAVVYIRQRYEDKDEYNRIYKLREDKQASIDDEVINQQKPVNVYFKVTDVKMVYDYGKVPFIASDNRIYVTLLNNKKVHLSEPANISRLRSADYDKDEYEGSSIIVRDKYLNLEIVYAFDYEVEIKARGKELYDMIDSIYSGSDCDECGLPGMCDDQCKFCGERDYDRDY